MADIPKWTLDGDWFDVCKCNIPCPCEFAQPPTFGECDGILAWHVRKGSYGDVKLDGLNVLAVGHLVGNIWAGAKAEMGIFIDDRANDRQREALQMIFGGQAGGWPGEFAKNSAKCAAWIRQDRIRACERSRDMASIRAWPCGGESRGADRSDNASRTTCSDDQSTRLGNRSGPERRRDVGNRDDRSRRRVRLQMESQRSIEQAHRVLLERSRVIGRAR